MDCDGLTTPCRTAQGSSSHHVTPLFTIAALERTPHEPALALNSNTNNNSSSMESCGVGGACTPRQEDITGHVLPLSAQQRTHEQQRRRSPSPNLARSPAKAYLSLRRLLEEVERQQSKLTSRLASEDADIHTVDAHAEGEQTSFFPAAAAAAATTPHDVRARTLSTTSLSSSSHASLSTQWTRQSATAGRALRRLSYLAQWTQQLLEAYPLVEDSDDDPVASPASLPLEDAFTAPPRSECQQAAADVDADGAAAQVEEREEGTTGGGASSGGVEVLGGAQDQDADTHSTRQSATANAAPAAADVVMGEEENSIVEAAAGAATTVPTARPADINAIDNTEGEGRAHDSTTTPAGADAAALKCQQSLHTAHTGALVHLIALPAVDAAATSEDNRAAVCEHQLHEDGESDSKHGALKDREGPAAGICRRPDRIADVKKHTVAAAAASSSLSSPPPPPVVPRHRQPLRCDVGPAYDPPRTAAEQRAVLLAQGGCCAHCGTILPLPRHDICAAWWAAVSGCCCCCCCCWCSDGGGGGGDDPSAHDDASEDSGDEHQTFLSQPPHDRGGTAAEASESRRSPTPSNVVRRLRLTSSLSSTTGLVMPADVLADMTAPATTSSTVIPSINATRGSSSTTGSAEALFCTFEGRFLCPRCFDAPLGSAATAAQRLVEPEEWQTRAIDHHCNNDSYHGGDNTQSTSPVRAAVTQAAERVSRWWDARHAAEGATTAQRSQQSQPPLSVSGHGQHQYQLRERMRCLLPAHVLLRWDFNRYPVSASAAALLRRMERPDASSTSCAVSRPSQMDGWGDAGANRSVAAASETASSSWVLPTLYDISHVHPALYREVPALATASQLRKRLCLLHAQAWWCLRYRSEVWGVHQPNTSSRINNDNGAPTQCDGDASSTAVPGSRQQRTTVFMPAHDVESAGKIDFHVSGDDDGEGKDAETAAAQRWRAATPSPPRCPPRRRYLVERAEGWSLLDLCRLTSAQGAAGGTPQLVVELRTVQAALQEHVRECAYCLVRRRVTSEGQ